MFFDCIVYSCFSSSKLFFYEYVTMYTKMYQQHYNLDDNYCNNWKYFVAWERNYWFT